MPTQIYASYNDTARASVGTSYDAAKVHAHAMNTNSARNTETFIGWLQLLVVQVSNISSATTLTVRVCRDAAGDEMVVPDVTATISTGITTATDGSIAVSVDAPYVNHTNADDLYVFFKTDAGTVTVDSTNFSWTEQG